MVYGNIGYSSGNESGRIVHTGFYSDRALQVLSSMMDEIHAMYANSKRTFKISSTNATAVRRADDNEVVLFCGAGKRYWSAGRRYWNNEFAFSGWSDAKILDFIAWTMKCKMQKLISKAANAAWSRTCSELFYLGTASGIPVKVKEIYYIYDNFRKRKNLEKYYSSELRDSFIGKTLDPIMVEIKVAQREEIKKIQLELHNKVDALQSACRKEQNKMYSDIEDKYKTQIAEARKAAEEKIAKINEEMASISTSIAAA